MPKEKESRPIKKTPSCPKCKDSGRVLDNEERMYVTCTCKTLKE